MKFSYFKMFYNPFIINNISSRKWKFLLKYFDIDLSKRHIRIGKK